MQQNPKMKSFQLFRAEKKLTRKMKSFQLFQGEKKKNEVRKMKSFQLFRDKKAKDWRESVAKGVEFFQKNKQAVWLFVLGFVTFPIVLFLTISLAEGSTGLVRGLVNSPKVNVSSTKLSLSPGESAYLSFSSTNADGVWITCSGGFSFNSDSGLKEIASYGPLSYEGLFANGATTTCVFTPYAENGAKKGVAKSLIFKAVSSSSSNISSTTSNSSAKENVSTSTTATTATTTAASTEAASSNSGSSSSDIDLSKVVWLHTNVSNWKVTANLSSVNLSSSSITLAYDKANTWKGVSIDGLSLNANPWVFVKQNGTWYAATWEWLKVGQTTKSISSVNGNHIKVSPLSSWSPKSGETYGFMVSGLARDSRRNVEERSNIVMVKWGSSGASSGSVSASSTTTNTAATSSNNSSGTSKNSSTGESTTTSSTTTTSSSSGGYYCPSDCYLNSDLKWCYYKGSGASCGSASTSSNVAKCTSAYTYCAGNSSCMWDNDYDMGMCPKNSGSTANGGDEGDSLSNSGDMDGDGVNDGDAAGAALDPSSMGDFGHTGDGTGQTSNTGRDAAGGLGIVCFPSGTRITLADGLTKNIEDIGAGDLILSYNIKKQQSEPSLILSMRAPHLREGIYTITFSDSTKLRVTDDHPLYVTNEKGWSSINPAKSQKSYSAKVGQIEIGDRILQESGKDLTIKSITYHESSTMVYTIGKVSSNDNFFADGSLAHVSE